MNSIAFFKALLMKEMDEELKGGQKKLDVAEPKGKITAADFKALRAKKDVKKEAVTSPKVQEMFDKITDSLSKISKSLSDDEVHELHEKLKGWFNKLYEETPNSPTDYSGNPGIPGVGPIVHEDHEVGMAQNSLESIIKSALELKAKLGNDERNIPGWVQDHITNAENYIDQAAQGFHELDQDDQEAPTDELPDGTEELPAGDEEDADMTLQGLMESLLAEYEVIYRVENHRCYRITDEGYKDEVNMSYCRRFANEAKKKPSAGLSKKQKSAIVKKAKKGKDFGKKGPGFQDIVKKAKASGAKDPQAVAGAAFWKGQAKKAK